MALRLSPFRWLRPNAIRVRTQQMLGLRRPTAARDAVRPTEERTREKRPALVAVRRVVGDSYSVAVSIGARPCNDLRCGVNPFAMMSGGGDGEIERPPIGPIPEDGGERGTAAQAFTDLGPNDCAAAVVVSDAANSGHGAGVTAVVAWLLRMQRIARLPQPIQAAPIQEMLHALLPSAAVIHPDDLAPMLDFFREALATTNPLPGQLIRTAFLTALERLRDADMPDGLAAHWYCVAELLPSEHASDITLPLAFMADIFRGLTAQREQIVGALLPYLEMYAPDRVRACSYLFAYADAGDGSMVTRTPFTSLNAMAEYETALVGRSGREAVAQLNNYLIYVEQPQRLIAACQVVCDHQLMTAGAALEKILADGRMGRMHKAVRKTLRHLHARANDPQEKQQALVPLWAEAIRAGRKKEANTLRQRIAALVTLDLQRKAAAVVAETSRFEMPPDLVALEAALPKIASEPSVERYYAIVKELARTIAPDVDIRLVQSRQFSRCLSAPDPEFGSTGAYDVVNIHDVDQLLSRGVEHADCRELLFDIARKIFEATHMVLPDGTTLLVPGSKKRRWKKERVIALGAIEQTIRTGTFSKAVLKNSSGSLESVPWQTIELVVPHLTEQTEALQRLLGALYHLQYRDIHAPLHQRGTALTICTPMGDDRELTNATLKTLNPHGVERVTLAHKRADGTHTEIATSRRTLPTHRVDLALQPTGEAAWHGHLVSAALDRAAAVHQQYGRFEIDRWTSLTPLRLNLALPETAATLPALLPFLDRLALHPTLQPIPRPWGIFAGGTVFIGSVVASVAALVSHAPMFVIGMGIMTALTSIWGFFSATLKSTDFRTAMQRTMLLTHNDQPLLSAARDERSNAVQVVFHAAHPHAKELCAHWNTIKGAPHAEISAE